jgi:trimeric autotransporter adhesin
MKGKNYMKTITTITYPAFAIFAFVCFGLLSHAYAVVPPPDGGYAGGNTAEGQSALLSLTTGIYNTAVGVFSIESNGTGKFNTGVGAGVLLANTADENTATGAGALLSNTTGTGNTANGTFALFNNTTGIGNSATGYQALSGNTDGAGNTAVGQIALMQNQAGSFNTAVGGGVLSSNVDGSFNTALGYDALVTNTGDNNTAVGNSALFENTAGSGNTAVGISALQSNTTSFDNTAVGTGALVASTGNSNTAVGSGALSNNTTGEFNVAVGYNTGLNQDTGSNNVYIGAGINGIAGEIDTCRIKSIFGQTAANGSAVFISSGNKLGTDTSSKRFKEDIGPMDKASETLLALKPVTFRYKKEIDPDRKSQFGLVAEDVEKVNPDLVVRDKEGKPYSVRYEQVNAMLLNEFLKEHKTVQKLKSTVQKQEVIIAQQQKRFGSKLAEQEKQIAAMALGLQKVSAQIEVGKSATQAVVEK